MEIQLTDKLTTYQEDVYDWLGDCKGSGKIAVIKSCRQTGKSFFCRLMLLTIAFGSNTKSVYVAPTLLQSNDMFKSIVNVLKYTNLIETANASNYTIVFSNGSSILFRSTAQGSSLRGLTVSGILILDECAYLSDDDIFTILPFVNAHNAPILIASTPFTRDGYFYEMYMKGLEDKDNIKSFDWASEPEISRFLTDERKALYKQTMSPNKYLTEVDGQFISENGLLFQNLDACTKDCNNARTLYIGIDFGTGSNGDYTVVSAINEQGQQYKLYRTNNLSPMQQVDWIDGLINELSSHCVIAKILAEKNSLGAVYIDALNSRLGEVKITDWTTSNSSKQDLVTTLQIALENEQITILPNNVLLNELKRYEAEINQKTKKVSYNGKGAHDDCVIATMLSYYAYKNSFGTYSISFGKKKKHKISLREKYG